MKKLWMIGALMMAVLSAAEANTRFGFGTITAVDTGPNPTFTISCEFYNLQPHDIFKGTRYPFYGKTRHGASVYLLDGKPSTPEEALKVGRAVCISDNEMVFHVSSQPGPQVPGAVGAVGNGIYRIDLPGAFLAPLGQVEGGVVKTDYTIRPNSATVLVDCRQGKVVHAVAVVGLLDRCDYLVDPSALRLEAGRLTGQIAFEAVFSDRDRYISRDRKPVNVLYKLDIGVDEKGNLAGPVTGTCGDAEVSVKATGTIIAPTPARNTHRVWLQFDDFGCNSHGYIVLPAADGTVQDGYVLFAKGSRIGTATVKNLKLAENRLRGTLTIAIGEKGQGGTQEMELDGRVFGDRMIFGIWTAPGGVTRTFRGGLVSLEGPQIESVTPEQKVLVKSMQEALANKKLDAPATGQPAK